MVRYTTLDPKRSEIRVLLLHRGKTSDPIRCTLRTVSLDNPPYFEALSYVWGDMSVRKPITVDGEEFQVTVNLESALRALRRPFRQRTLWVDAVCINQNDIPEKNIQVPQMGRLYSGAGDVLVWLGPSDPSIELAVSWAHTYIAKKYTSASAYWLKLDALAPFSGSIRHEKSRASLQALEGYLDLLGLPYWNRMWTFQEFCLPRDEPLCYCGDVSFKATAVQCAQAAILGAGLGFLDLLIETTARDWSILTDKEKEERSQIKSRIESKCQVVLGNTLPPLHKMRNDWRVAENPLLYLIGTTVERNCYDKKDKVYALYGMVPAIQQVYPPDYAKPTRDVMLETTAYMINHEHAPVIWSFFELRDDRLSLDSPYPSWIPDFTLVNSKTSSKSGSIADSLQRLEDVPPAKISPDLSTAHLWARNMGPCKVLLKFDSLASNVLINDIRGLLGKGPSAALETDTGRSIRNPDSLAPRMARALVAHHVRQHEYSTEEILNTFDLIYEFNIAGRPVGNHCWAMLEDVARDLAGRTVFVTEGGVFWFWGWGGWGWGFGGAGAAG